MSKHIMMFVHSPCILIRSRVRMGNTSKRIDFLLEGEIALTRIISLIQEITTLLLPVQQRGHYGLV
jgi:hypothetical protein